MPALPVVRKVAKILFNDPTLNREYLPIAGLPEFTSTAACLILGADSVAIGEKQVASMQTISGTGANHLGASFFGRFRIFNGAEQIYLSEPTWANHPVILGNAGTDPLTRRYHDPETTGPASNEFPGNLSSAPESNISNVPRGAHSSASSASVKWSQKKRGTTDTSPPLPNL